MSKIPEKQRALVLQGGGALGAYEVGILKTLFRKLKEEEEDDDNPFFDIIAGTSIGAINATILVNYVTNKKKENPNLAPKECWQGSIEKLEDFWTNILAVPTPLNAQLISNGWWWQQNESKENISIATQEAARRYYSTKQFFATGVNTVFARPEIIYDSKFFDNFPYSPPNNVWYRYNNNPLRESIESVVGKNFSLKNKPYNSEIIDSSAIEGPRLLIVSVDVEESAPVTFDSYGKLNNEGKIYEWKTEYGDSAKHTIRYDNGITLDHVMASATIPITYDYQEISGRKFWDGGVLSNTPLRELVGKHKDFWKNEIDEEKLREGKWKTDPKTTNNDKVPDLEVYVINVWPSKEENPPSNYDGVKDRYNDIRYNDKTKYDQTVTSLVSDYIHLVKEVRNTAMNCLKNKDERDRFIKELDEILNDSVKSKSKKGDGKPKEYNDLLTGSVELTKVIRIEREDNRNDISSKFADFTSETINNLISLGEKDASRVLNKTTE
jgi:NTE family protein